MAFTESVLDFLLAVYATPVGLLSCEREHPRQFHDSLRERNESFFFNVGLNMVSYDAQIPCYL